MRNGLGPRTRKFGFDGYGHLDWFGQNLRPRTRKFGFYGKWIPDPKQDSMLENLDLRSGQNTVSTVLNDFMCKRIWILLQERKLVWSTWLGGKLELLNQRKKRQENGVKVSIYGRFCEERKKTFEARIRSPSWSELGSFCG